MAVTTWAASRGVSSVFDADIGFLPSKFDEHRTKASISVEPGTTMGVVTTAEEIAEPETASLEIHRVLHALSDPVRLDVVRQLELGSECSCGAVSSPVGKSTLSHHLKVLREAGVTHTRRVGTSRFVSLRRADLDARFPGLLDAILQGAAISA
jgi:DNA-binding transcriptional ArsR family regulator